MSTDRHSHSNKAIAIGDPANLERLLALLRQQAIARGRSEDEVEGGRQIMQRRGCSRSEIASCEFAELRLFEDVADTSQRVADAALAGTPSEVTMALVERDGYCPNCVQHW